MHWIIGVDLQQAHSAPLELATWLDISSTFVVTHFIDRALLRTLQPDVVDQVCEGATVALANAVTRAGLARRAEVVLAHGASPENALADLAAERKADAIVVARRAAVGEDRVFRLGRVARRLLRRLPSRIVVVPPELSAEGIRGGPVLLAVDGIHDPRSAARFASEVANVHEREVEMVHVYRTPFAAGASQAPAAYRSGMHRRYREQQHEKLQSWLDLYGLTGSQVHEVEGETVARITHVAVDRGACMVVCASRQMTASERIFNSSVGSLLAASAPFPVAVVGNVP